MVTLDRESEIPVYIVRGLEVVFTCITFSLVASVGHSTNSYWTWCMFTWCFCFTLTILILVLEISNLNLKLPISWGDFTCAFAMLASLMTLSVSIIYSIHFTRSSYSRQIGASVCSWLAFILYSIEVGMIRARPGEISGFLTTVPGLLKVKETYVACIIFINLDSFVYTHYPGLQWCLAVYSICFIFSFIIILFTIGRLLTLFPAPFKKVLTFVNVLAVLMYITAVVIWPLYSFKDKHIQYIYTRLVVISFMSCVNLVLYIVDTVYSMKLIFSVSST